MKVEKTFITDESDIARNWNEAFCVEFCAIVEKHEVPAAIRKVKARAKAWIKAHENCYAESVSTDDYYNGKIAISLCVIKENTID